MIIAPPTLLLLLLPPFLYTYSIIYISSCGLWKRTTVSLLCVYIFFFLGSLLICWREPRENSRPASWLLSLDWTRLSLSTLPSMFFLFFFSLSRRRRAHTEPSDQWTVHATSNRLNYIHDVLLTAGLAGAVPVTSAGLWRPCPRRVLFVCRSRNHLCE